MAWYRDKLGFVVEKEWTVDGLLGVRLAYLKGAGFRIEITAGAHGTPVAPPTDFADHFNRFGFGHLCFWTGDVDQTMLRLSNLGVPAFVPAQNYPFGAERRAPLS